MLKKGIYFAPSSYEAGFLSIKHSAKDINYTINCAENVFKYLKEN